MFFLYFSDIWIPAGISVVPKSIRNIVLIDGVLYSNNNESFAYTEFKYDHTNTNSIIPTQIVINIRGVNEFMFTSTALHELSHAFNPDPEAHSTSWLKTCGLLMGLVWSHIQTYSFGLRHLRFCAAERGYNVIPSEYLALHLDEFNTINIKNAQGLALGP